MKVFVAGAGGAIGSKLIPALRRAGHEVTAMVRTESKRERLQALGAKVVIADALDAASVARAVSGARPAVVIHELTALSSGGEMKNFDQDFELTNRLRTEGTDHLLKAAREAGAKRFIAQSFGGWVYTRTGARDQLKTEDDPLDPTPPRDAVMSLEAIRHLEEATLGASGITGIVLRYGYFYGPGTSIARDGSVVREVMRGRIPIVGSGAGRWSFCHIEDAGNLTALAVDRGEAGIYNVVDDEPAPVFTWLPELARALGARKPPRAPAWLAQFLIGPNAISMMTQIRGMSNEKVKRVFGWEPQWRSWREGFQRGL